MLFDRLEPTFDVESIGGIVGEGQNTAIYYAINFGEIFSIYHDQLNEVVSNTEYVAGILGYARLSNMIKYSANYGSVIGFSEMGGIVGGTGATTDYWHTLVVEESLNRGTINGYDKVGGLVGSVDGTFNLVLKNSFNQGIIDGQYIVGGLLGEFAAFNSVDSIILNSYNTGTIRGLSLIGGLVGSSFPDDYGSDSYSLGVLHIESSFNVGIIDPHFLGFNGNDYFNVYAGSIIGFRGLGGDLTFVSYLKQSQLVDLYDIVSNEAEVYGTQSMTVPASGFGFGFDTFVVNSMAIFEEGNFLYENLWNLQQTWTFIDELPLPQLRNNIANTIAI